MSKLKLGIKEKLEIEESMIYKYNLKDGGISPFTRLEIFDEDSLEDEIDIRKPIKKDDIDIKKISKNKDTDDDIDIKKISKNKDTDDDIDIKKIPQNKE